MNAVRPHTPAQQATLKSLLSELAGFDRPRALELWKVLGEAEGKGELTVVAASLMITSLIREVKVVKYAVEAKTRLAAVMAVTAEESIEIAKRRNEREDVPEVPEGHYAVATDEGHLAFYRVRVNGKSGYVTVELQLSENFQKLPWAQTKTILRKIDAVGPLEAAQTYGRALEICGKCHRPLTNPESRAIGIGPECRKKYAA